jgi:hypothetical protein
MTADGSYFGRSYARLNVKNQGVRRYDSGTIREAEEPFPVRLAARLS